MSVCRKLPDGTIQKIAGHTILLDANAAEIREGTFTVPAASAGDAAEVTVTFTDPMPDTDYAVVLSDVTNGTAAVTSEVFNKQTTGFTVQVGRPYSGSSVGGTGHYIAWKPIKLEGYTALQNKVNSPDDTPTIDSMNLVTSDGVARAIENASAVWKGTKAEWNALPAADKKKYDLAVLLDKTLVKAVDRETGNENDVANLNKIFRGTEAEWQALSAAEKDKYDEAVTTGEQNPVAWPFPHPDWAHAVAITLAQLKAGYVAPSDGMIVGAIDAATSIATSGTYSLTVNNVVLARVSVAGSGMYDNADIACAVNENDTIKISGASFPINAYISFIPWKQV